MSDEIATQLSKIAMANNQTSYALANECLGASLSICEQGGRPDEIYGAWIMNKIGKDVGALQWIGRNLIEQIVHELARLEPEKSLAIWREAGFNFGVYLQICHPTVQDVVDLVTKLKQSFNIGRIELVERDREQDQMFTLSVVTPYSSETLTYLGEYWRGLLSAYGLEVLESKISSGAVKISFSSPGQLRKVEPQIIR